MYGKLTEYGNAPYNFDNTNEESFFIKLLNRGELKTYWSLGFKDALDDSDLTIGDMAKFKFEHKETVILKNGKTSHRSYFSAIKAEKPQDASKQPEFYTSDNPASYKERKNDNGSTRNSSSSEPRPKKSKWPSRIVGITLLAIWIIAGLSN
jgi:hypothetical protein